MNENKRISLLHIELLALLLLLFISTVSTYMAYVQEFVHYYLIQTWQMKVNRIYTHTHLILKSTAPAIIIDTIHVLHI